MPERWRELLGRLGEEEPDRDRVRPHPGESRFPSEPAPRRSRVIAGAVAVVLAVTSFVFVRSAFDDGASAPSPVATGADQIDPGAVCEVPTYDPTIALLGEIGYPEVVLEPGPLEVPLAVLEEEGVAPDDMGGVLGEALRSYVASPQAIHAPTSGWRVIVEGDDRVIMAAPEPSPSAWWVTKFVRTDSGWDGRVEEIVEQHPTPAQRGHGLDLSWSGDVVLEDGSWMSTLELVNPGGERWVDPDGGPAFAGEVAVFDADAAQVGRMVGGSGLEIVGEIEPGGSVSLAITLGGALGSLSPGRSDLVACVPELGLASPVGSLVVDEDPSVDGVHVLTYPSSGAIMQALGHGTLRVHEGCLALEHSEGRPTFVIWPDGHALVDRGGRQVLIDPIGEAVAEIGQEVELVGGYASFEHAEPIATDEIPGSCQTGGEGYFITGGLAELGPG